ncbi:hypothetical protein GCM10007418_20350 [Halopseudomonas salina]|uniref:Uncharacterized protein n=1 Tax=Halopseudomonas salina TaxID=1323744 RepID=A0ABQ1PQH5_9GAMM|nr:hypothetical protein GCM10007418_20350 [Halopseudomonas salina]
MLMTQQTKVLPGLPNHEYRQQDASHRHQQDAGIDRQALSWARGNCGLGSFDDIFVIIQKAQLCATVCSSIMLSQAADPDAVQSGAHERGKFALKAQLG